MSKNRRTGLERRSFEDGRRLFEYTSPFYDGPERRSYEDRRAGPEKRIEWVRVSNSSSKSVRSFKRMLRYYSD